MPIAGVGRAHSSDRARNRTCFRVATRLTIRGRLRPAWRGKGASAVASSSFGTATHAKCSSRNQSGSVGISRPGFSRHQTDKRREYRRARSSRGRAAVAAFAGDRRQVGRASTGPVPSCTTSSAEAIGGSGNATAGARACFELARPHPDDRMLRHRVSLGSGRPPVCEPCAHGVRSIGASPQRGGVALAAPLLAGLWHVDPQRSAPPTRRSP